MEISAEISMYPLDQNFVKPIIAFIDKLKRYKEIVVQSNGMSTQIFGPYKEVMYIITHEVEASFLQEEKVVFVMKLINDTMR